MIIVIISILFLFFLVYIGMKHTEGMTLKTSSNLGTLLENYSKLQKKNADEKINNSKNEDTTMEGIMELKLTDPNITLILNNQDLNNASKINTLNTLMKNIITQDMANSVSITNFNQMADVFTTLNDPNEQIIELKNLSIGDPRFNTLFQGDNPTIITNIKTTMLNLINPV